MMSYSWKNKIIAIKTLVLCFVLILPTIALVGCLGDDDSPKGEAVLPLEEFVIRTQKGDRFVFNLEVARTPEQQLKGLMHRSYLPEDEGMAFPAERSRVFNMWMKDTKIPLDMLFVDSFGEIRHVHWDAEPFSEEIINSRFPVQVVLELQGGVALDKDINPGDFVFHPLFANMDKIDEPELPETAMDRLNKQQAEYAEAEQERIRLWEERKAKMEAEERLKQEMSLDDVEEGTLDDSGSASDLEVIDLNTSGSED